MEPNSNNQSPTPQEPGLPVTPEAVVSNISSFDTAPVAPEVPTAFTPEVAPSAHEPVAVEQSAAAFNPEAYAVVEVAESAAPEVPEVAAVPSTPVESVQPAVPGVVTEVPVAPAPEQNTVSANTAAPTPTSEVTAPLAIPAAAAKKSNKVAVTVLSAVLVLLAGGAAAFYFLA